MIMDIFYQEINDANIAKMAIDNAYGEFLKAMIAGKKEIDGIGFDSSREQYNASALLLELTKLKNLFLWIVNEDLYVEGMNFVFGCALPYRGAVLSTYRLDSDELVKKEVIHEVGHVLGLQHCRNYCVMRFSNSVRDAKQKPSYLCESCKSKLNELWKK